MNNELVEIVEQLMEFGYGDSSRLDSMLKRLRNDESLYQSDQKYVDMLVSNYLYPHIEEDIGPKESMSFLEKKIRNVKMEYAGEIKSARHENVLDICPKCGSTVPRMFSFCSRCGAFHDEHNFVENRITKKPLKKKKYGGLAVAGIISVILGIAPIVLLFQYSNLCSSIIGQFVQFLNLQAYVQCSYIQMLPIGGGVLFIVGIILLVIRTVNLKKEKRY